MIDWSKRPVEPDRKNFLREIVHFAETVNVMGTPSNFDDYSRELSWAISVMERRKAALQKEKEREYEQFLCFGR